MRSSSAAHGHHFNPLPPCGGRRLKYCQYASLAQFQSTPSVWRETLSCANAPACVSHFNPLPPCGGRRRCACALVDLKAISIHSLRVEGDAPVFLRLPPRVDFNPLPPCGGRQYFTIRPTCGQQFQSTPSVWRETDHRAGAV